MVAGPVLREFDHKEHDMALHTLDRADAHTSDPLERTPTIVVGFDASAESHAALRAAIERAGPGDRIAVVHAYAKVPDWMGYPYYHQSVVQAQDDARGVLAEAADIARGAAAEVSLEMHEGAPADVLARIAALREADEIVVGTRGLGRLRGALGSVAQEVVRTADRPVLVVPARSTEAA
jgi:nucleotide-binding universal stress UspA family protein